jgi:predicted dehydrogenase
MQITAFLGVAHIHTPGFVRTINKRDDVKAKYVYDHESERAARNAAELGARTADIETILADPEVTSVVICSETRHHVELIEKAAAAGKHLFVEKPLAITGEDAARIAEAVKKAGVIFQTGFFQRGSAANQFIKQQIEAGALGTITRARYTNCHQGSLAGWFDTEWNWIADVNEAGGGGFADLGAHGLDILLWLLQPACGPAVQFAATLGSATGRYGDIDEWGTGIVTFESGAAAVLEASWVDPKLRSPVEIHGTKGEIIVFNGTVYFYSELVEGADGGEWTELPEPLPHAFDLFWDKLEGQDVPLISIDQAAEESRVMHQLYKSAK